MPRHPRSSGSCLPLRLIGCASVAIAFLPVGCDTPLPVGTLEQREELAALRYPADAPPGDPLQIEARRSGAEVRFINREPRELRDATLWLNQEYVGRIDRLAIGPGNAVNLNRFVNRHGEVFPTGNLLAPDDTIALISVELIARDGEGQSVRRPFTVWPDKRWFED